MSDVTAWIGELPERIAEKISVDDDSGCWLWTGSTDQAGYSRMIVKISTGEWVGRIAHRWIYQQLVGPIGEGLEIDHLCRVPNCVNPRHMEPVTHAENNRRTAGFRPKKTHCKRGHEIAKVGRDSSRRCIACRNENQQKRRRLVGPWKREDT